MAPSDSPALLLPYNEEGITMWILKVEDQFHAAHRLNDYEGKCANLHGHTWKIIVHIEAYELEANGISIDFGIVKQILKEVLPDHADLNAFYDFNPTAENISRDIYKRLRDKLPLDSKDGYRVVAVELYETNKNRVIYKP